MVRYQLNVLHLAAPLAGAVSVACGRSVCARKRGG